MRILQRKDEKKAIETCRQQASFLREEHCFLWGSGVQNMSDQTFSTWNLWSPCQWASTKIFIPIRLKMKRCRENYTSLSTGISAPLFKTTPLATIVNCFVFILPEDNDQMLWAQQRVHCPSFHWKKETAKSDKKWRSYPISKTSYLFLWKVQRKKIGCLWGCITLPFLVRFCFFFFPAKA